MEHTGFYFGMLKLMAYCILTSSYKIQVNLLLPTHFCAFLIVYRIMHSFIVYRLNTFVLDYSESCFWLKDIFSPKEPIDFNNSNDVIAPICHYFCNFVSPAVFTGDSAMTHVP